MQSAPDDQFSFTGQTPSESPAQPSPPVQPEPEYILSQAPSANIPVKKKKSLLGSILFFLIFLLVIGVAGAGAATVYGRVELPFISVDQRRGIVKLAAKLPFIPKTAEQIVLTAYEANKQLKTYNPEFSMSGSVGGTAIGLGSVDLKLMGPIDFNDPKNFTFDINVDVGVNIAGSLYTGKGKLLKVGETVYGKIDEISENVFGILGNFGAHSSTMTSAEIKHNLDAVFTNWVSYDTKGIDSQARKQLMEHSQEQSLIDSANKKTLQFLTDKMVLSEIKLLSSEVIDNVRSFHIQVIPTKETMTKLIKESLPEDKRSSTDNLKAIDAVVGGVDLLQVDSWYGEADYLTRKMTVTSQVNLESISKAYMDMATSPVAAVLNPFESIGGQKLNLTLAILVRDINKPVSVTTPTPVKTIDEYGQLLENGLKTEAQKKQEAQRTQFNADMKILSDGLLKYYVAKGVYPAALNELTGAYIKTTDPILLRVASYQYRLRSNGKKFVLYIESPGTMMYANYTPYYGITSESLYPHELMQKDFD